MALTKCPYCYFEIMTRTNTCPHCDRQLNAVERKTIPRAKWKPAFDAINKEISNNYKPNSRTWISICKYRTDETSDGEATYYIFILDLQYWANSISEKTLCRQLLLNVVSKMDKLCEEYNRKTGMRFSIEYYFEPKLSY